LILQGTQGKADEKSTGQGAKRWDPVGTDQDEPNRPTHPICKGIPAQSPIEDLTPERKGRKVAKM